MSRSSHRILVASVALAAVAAFVWRSSDSPLEAGGDSGDGSLPWQPGLPRTDHICPHLEHLRYAREAECYSEDGVLFYVTR